MSQLQSFLQEAVVRTNAIFPFSSLNRLPYSLAVHRFVGLCRCFPEIRGVYLRHGMTQKGWVPGLSDIDLTVMFASGPSPAEEFQFLTVFWNKTIALRRWFPMLTDIVMVKESELATSTRSGTRGKEASRWVALCGETPKIAYDNSRALEDALGDSLLRLETLLAWYLEPPSYINLKRMQRLATRIFRDAAAGVSPTEDPARLVARVVLGLDRWIAGSSGVDEALSAECQIVHRDTCIVVVPAGMSEDDLQKQLQEIRNKPPARQIRIATPRMLRHWFHRFNPLQYRDWMERSEILCGSDVLAQLGPPSQEVCLQSLLETSSQILEFPYRENVIAQKRAEWYAEAAFTSMVDRGLQLRLYVETGIHQRLRRENQREIESRYRSFVEELQDIQKVARSEAGDLRQLRYRGFCLLRETAAAVHEAMMGEKSNEVHG